MNSLKYIFGGEDTCVCGTVINNEQFYSCETLNRENSSSLEYSVMFNTTIVQQKEVIQILNKNKKVFEKITLAQDSPRADTCSYKKHCQVEVQGKYF